MVCLTIEQHMEHLKDLEQKLIGHSGLDNAEKKQVPWIRLHESHTWINAGHLSDQWSPSKINLIILAIRNVIAVE